MLKFSGVDSNSLCAARSMVSLSWVVFFVVAFMSFVLRHIQTVKDFSATLVRRTPLETDALLHA